MEELNELAKKVSKNQLRFSLEDSKTYQKTFYRPTEVIIKHRELLRNALLLEKTLITLQADLQRITLQKAMELDPWELITIPTIQENPVSPKKKIIIDKPKDIRIIRGARPISNESQKRIFSTKYKIPEANVNIEKIKPNKVATLIGVLELLIIPTKA